MTLRQPEMHLPAFRLFREHSKQQPVRTWSTLVSSLSVCQSLTYSYLAGIYVFILQVPQSSTLSMSLDPT